MNSGTPRLILVAQILAWLAPAALAVPSSQAGGPFDVREFGARGDGKTKETKSLQAAIDAAFDAGGGTVVLPKGTFLSGTIYLKDGVRLYLSPHATLLGSPDIADYPMNPCQVASASDRYTCRALIWGEGLHDIGILGDGTIDGNGSKFLDLMPTDKEVEQANVILADANRYTPKRPFLNRPFVIRLIRCRRITIEGITLRNSPMWMQQYLECEFLRVRGITVYNHASKNNDMIDVDGCRDVVISDCIGDTDDDALTLKSTSLRPTENVVITNCILSSHCNAIKAGTESSGGFKNITISNCVIRPSHDREPLYGRADGLAGLAFMIVDGGVLDGLTVSNVAIHGQSTPIFLRLGDRGRPVSKGQPKRAIGSVRNINLNNIVATGASAMTCSITGLPDHPIENVHISNVMLEVAGSGNYRDPATIPERPTKYPESIMFGAPPAYGFYCRHVNRLSFRDVHFQVRTIDKRPAIVCDGVHGLTIHSLNAESSSSAPAEIVLRNTTDAIVRGCRPAKGVSTFLLLKGMCEDIAVSGNDLSRCETPFVYESPVLSSALRACDNFLRRD